MRHVTPGIALAALLSVVPARAPAFSVLAHQAVIDATWDDAIVPAIRRRFPRVDDEQLRRSRGFAYGGSHVADLGYFPLGSRLFTDLVHYVRSGDFVAALADTATTPEEYAFALGAISHWVTDDVGHPEATNRTVPEIYPELRRKYGDSVAYADGRSEHLETEFRFDVFQVGRSQQSPDLYKHAIEFEVSQPVLERAFAATYGVRLDDVFPSTSVAITTYRWAFRGLIHEATGIAWELYRADIQSLDPRATEASFVWDMSRADFEKQFGDAFREPGYFARFVAFLVKLVPDVGPLARLPYRPLPADARQRFTDAQARAEARFRGTLARWPGASLAGHDDNLDVGRPTGYGEYEPADKAYASLVEMLDDRHFAGVGPGLRAAIRRFYGDASSGEEDDDLRGALGRLAALPPLPPHP